MSSSLSDALSLPRPVTQSRVWQALTGIKPRLSAAANTSRLTSTGQFLAQATRNSWLYRWLTKEPDPEVIVIDLRETWTVGPIIAILDRVLGVLHTGYQGSILQQFVTALSRQVRTQPVRLLAGLVTLSVILSLGYLTAQDSLSTTSIVAGGLLFLLGLLGLFVDLTLSDLKETRLVQLLIRVLEPPEPPETE